MAKIRPEQLASASYSITGSFTGSFIGDGSGLYNLPFQGGIWNQTGSFWATTNDLQVTGSFTIVNTSSVDDIFLIKGANNTTMLSVSSSGVIVLSTQSIELTNPAPNGGIYFTSSSLFVGLD